MGIDRTNVMKALTGLAIEKTLLDIGKPVLDKVANKLYNEYRCYIPDCYEHPEYLNEVLKSVFGNSHLTVAESIRTQLMQHIGDEKISMLIRTIGV